MTFVQKCNRGFVNNNFISLGNFSLQLSSGNILLLCTAIAAGTALSVWTYRHTVPRTSPRRRRLLMTLRAIALALIIFAIFQPVLSLTKTNELLPQIALVLDKSKSMQLPQSGSDTSAANSRREAMLKSIGQLVPADILADSNALSAFVFADSATGLDGTTKSISSLRTDGPTTDISSLFQSLQEKTRRANIGAIILYTDGAYTAGANPIYAAEKLGVPVFAIGLGDSSDRKDVALGEIFTNEIATVGVAQPVDATVRITGVTSGERVPVSFFVEGEKIGEQVIQTRDGITEYSVSFNFTPKKEGTVKLTAKAASLPDGESTLSNNIRIAYVRVLKNTFKIILFAGAPSSDVSFIRQYFQGRKEVEFVSFVGKQGSEFYEGNPTAAKVSDVDLVILLGYPITETTAEQMSLIKRLLVAESRPMLFIPSRSVDYEKLKQIEEALPFTLKPGRISTNEIKVSTSLMPDKTDNPIMRTGSERDESKTHWEALAPLIKTETNFAAKPESEVLAEASIQGVKLGQPLIISRRVGRSRQIAFTGYGLWQWKLTSFGRAKAYESLSRSKDSASLKAESALDIFLGNSTRWLITRDDQKRVKIAPARRLYDAGERVEFTGQVYDESFVPVDGAIVTARITGEKLSAPIDIALEPLSGGRYQTSLLQGLPAGDYYYSGEAKKDGKVLGSDAGRFNVGEYSVEFAEPRMRSDVLRALAEKTGGKFYTPQDAGSLMRDIKANPRFRTSERSDKTDYEARNGWLLLAIAIALLGTEWFIRKRTGML